nr:hypothetical protein [Tanacetum cinerariifolium]
SRTVVREAISKLQASGLVETHQGKGTYVLARAEQSALHLKVETAFSVRHIIELRMGLETQAVALAALRRTHEQLAAMRPRRRPRRHVDTPEQQPRTACARRVTNRRVTGRGEVPDPARVLPAEQRQGGSVSFWVMACDAFPAKAGPTGGTHSDSGSGFSREEAVAITPNFGAYGLPG